VKVICEFVCSINKFQFGIRNISFDVAEYVNAFVYKFRWISISHVGIFDCLKFEMGCWVGIRARSRPSDPQKSSTGHFTKFSKKWNFNMSNL